MRSLDRANGRPLPNPRNNLFRVGKHWVIALALLGFLAGNFPACGAATGVDGVVRVNSASAKYLDFQRLVQPYLDNFGVPYTVQDIATNASTTNLTSCALVIIGHKQLDTNHVYLDSSAQVNISRAVSNGVGLVNFDTHLSIGAVARYPPTPLISRFTSLPPLTPPNPPLP